jgi:hypothetical protein
MPKILLKEKKIPEWKWYRFAVCSLPRDATTPYRTAFGSIEDDRLTGFAPMPRCPMKNPKN